ncbi:FAD-linked oxidase C-terminal domain-containing protein [Larkinella knui]|uniref:D-lactate dehydrogenase (cytochrome) n=1 Tax=Larkinella knui TaxID=2025310 RepID=A0A3P1CNE9_9BACT|nr:FAD-linked oxidase C-terminal domain-containing protein [Larkinella knui]RRB14738.1 FAD-binding protein [Larkinella knui]
MDRLLKQTVSAELRNLFGDRVTENTEIRNEHGAGYSYHACMPPDWVVFPRSTEEIAALVSICGTHQIPIIPFGAGTSLEGHILALKGGVCVDLRLMNQILEIDTANMCATVQAGVTRNQLDERLAGSGFFFPIGPGVNATLGGMASTRASGTNAVRYGTMKDNVLSLTVVLPDGKVIKTASKARKSSSGYDLTRLFIGSEGTLGILADLTIRLHSYPEAIYAAVCSFQNVEAAVNTAIKTIQAGVAIAKIELLDDLLMHAVNRYSGLAYPEKPTLLLEFQGSPAEIEAQITAVQAFARSFGATDFIWEKEEVARMKLWQARTDAAPAARAMVPGSKLMSTDVCVPISRLAECIVDTQADIAATGLFAPILGHVGDGNFHLSIPIDPAVPGQFEKAKALNERLVQRALALEGTCSGEHGIGVGKLAYLAQEHGEALEVMRAIKKAIDPTNLMNPGKLLPPVL